jgi:hypothetical protein
MQVKVLSGPALPFQTRRGEFPPSLSERINDFICEGDVNDNGYMCPVKSIDIKFCATPGEPNDVLYALIMYERDNGG